MKRQVYASIYYICVHKLFKLDSVIGVLKCSNLLSLCNLTLINQGLFECLLVHKYTHTLEHEKDPNVFFPPDYS